MVVTSVIGAAVVGGGHWLGWAPLARAAVPPMVRMEHAALGEAVVSSALAAVNEDVDGDLDIHDPYAPTDAVEELQFSSTSTGVVLADARTAEAHALRRVDKESVRDVVTRLITYSELMDLLGAWVNYEIPGIPSADSAVWIVSVLADGHFPPSAFGGLDPTLRSADGGFVAHQAVSGRNLAFSYYVQGDRASHERIRGMQNRDLAIAAELVTTAVESNE